MFDLDEKFWAKVDIRGDDECWEWLGAVTSEGYGKVKRRKINGNSGIPAHRYAYYLKHGKFPDNMCCHHCDNPRCVNPSHLYDGTAKENSRDCMERGRSTVVKLLGKKGEDNPRSKLTESTVREILQLFKEGLNNKQIAARYGVTHSNISAIRKGKSWGNIPRDL